jgi:cytoskeletal protein RodZ
VGKLGDTLRERRSALGITLEQVEQATHIRARLLQALEEGNYDRLPNPGYVRGYISSYARFLELDPIPLLNMYKAETGAGPQPKFDLPQTREAVAPTGQQHVVPRKGAFIFVLVVALIALAVWAVTRFWPGTEPTLPEPSTIDKPVPTTTPTTEPSETTEPAKVPEPQPEAQPFTLTVRTSDTGASWLRITVDGKPAYEGVLTAGQSKEFEVSDKASVRIGRPDSVTVLKDGKAVTIKDDGNVGIVTLSATVPSE